MQDGLFFRILRRVNLVMFTLVWVGLIALAGFAVWKHGLPKKVLETDVGYTAPIGPATVTYSLLPAMYGTPFGMQPTTPSIYVYSRSNTYRDAPYFRFGPDGDQIINLLVLDDKGDGHWLFPDNKQEITQRDAVHKGALAAPVPQGSADTRPVIGLVMQVVEGQPKATPAVQPGPDGLPGAYAVKLPTAVYMWKLGAAKAVKLLSVDDVVNSEQVGADRYDIVYKKGKETRAAVYSLPDFEKLSDKALPEAPK